MKKVIAIILVLIATGFVIGGGLAYWHIGKQNSASVKANLENQTEQEKVNSQQKLTEEYHSIEEYKEKFSKDAKYIKICTGDGSIDYSMFDVNNINAANQAVACYQMKYDQKRGTKEADAEYDSFRSYYLDFYIAQSKLVEFEYFPIEDLNSNEKLVENKLKSPSLKKAIEERTKKYYPYGLIVQSDEGAFMIAVSNKYLYENFSEYLSEPQKEFLKFNIQFDERIIYDGHYIVPKSVLENNLKFYRDFKIKYPEFSKEHNIDNIIEYKINAIKKYPIAY